MKQLTPPLIYQVPMQKRLMLPLRSKISADEGYREKEAMARVWANEHALD